MKDLSIICYSPDLSERWDSFVLHDSANGSVFHTRQFLSYHEEGKFSDCSILLFDGGQLVAIFPACLSDAKVYSHMGSSAGGPVIHKKYFKYSFITKVIESINDHYGGRKMAVKIPEQIFFPVANDAILFAYRHLGFTVIPELGSCKALGGTLIDSIPKQTTRNAIRKITNDPNYRFFIGENQHYEAFHEILSSNLGRHNAKPTHTLDEFARLAGILSDRQMLVLCANNEGNILAGVWLLKATSICWHTQYIAKNYNHNVNGVTEATLYKCFEIAKLDGVVYLNLGVSTERMGSYLNENLLSFKESLGTIHTSRYVLEHS